MRRRVLISILLVIAATVLTLGVPLSIVSWRVVDDLSHRDLSSRLQSIAASIANQSGSSEVDLGQLAAAVPEGGRLEIRMTGRIDQSIGALQTDEVYCEQFAMAGGGSLRLSVPETYLRAEQWTALALVALAVLLSVVVGTGVALLTAGRLVTPLTDVARRAARLGSGDFRTFRRRYGVPELDRVADVLDSSAQDIAALISRERDLAGDISHQLRTRLTGLRLRLEELAEHPDPLVVEEVSEALEQTDRLVAVVDDLLANARSERAAGAGEVVLFDELAEIDAEWGPRLAAANRTLAVRCPRDVVVHATPGRLREAIGVLVENSCCTVRARWGSPCDRRPGAAARWWCWRSATRVTASRKDSSRTSSIAGCRPRPPPGSVSAWPGLSSRRTAADSSCAGRHRRSSRSSWLSVSGLRRKPRGTTPT